MYSFLGMPVTKSKVAAPLTLGFSMNDDTPAGEDEAAEKAEAAEDPKGSSLIRPLGNVD